jgi:hypothetical protein
MSLVDTPLASAELAVVAARPQGTAARVCGVALFLVPRRRKDGELNYFIRLQDKTADPVCFCQWNELRNCGISSASKPPGSVLRCLFSCTRKLRCTGALKQPMHSMKRIVLIASIVSVMLTLLLNPVITNARPSHWPHWGHQNHGGAHISKKHHSTEPKAMHPKTAKRHRHP